jgi:hypothetical protein
MMLYMSAEDLDSSRCGLEALRFLRRKASPWGDLSAGPTSRIRGKENSCLVSASYYAE